MGIIWLIIKIILWTLLVCSTFIISVCMLVILAPIRYEAYLEKYDALNYEIKLRYLIGIKGHFYLQDGIQFSAISIFGKQVYSFKKEKDTQEKIDERQSKTVSLESGQGEKQAKEVPKHEIIKNKGQTLKKQQGLVKKSPLTNEHKVVEKIESMTSMLDEEVNDEQNFKPTQGGITSIIKEMVAVPKFLQILKGTFKLIKQLIIYIGPKEWSFELIIGKEDPADTGELMAKLIMLYPWYYQHGVIEGNYGTPGIWGGFLAQGKFCVAGILRRIIVFLWYRPVREFIKLILSQRKEEKDGK